MKRQKKYWMKILEGLLLFNNSSFFRYNESMENINEIFNNLTNDWDSDYAYLKECVKKTDNLVVIHKIWDLAYELANKDQKKIVDQEGFESVECIVERVERLIQNFDYVHAQTLLENYIQKMSDYAHGVYFNSIIEEVLYFQIMHVENKVIQDNVGLIYLLYGYVLQKQNQPVRAIYLKGIKQSPMDFRLRFAYIETFKEDLDTYFYLSKELLKLAYLPEQFKRIYRNLAYVYQARNELTKAQLFAYYGGLLKEKPKEINKVDIQIGASQDVIDCLYKLADKSEKDVALLCYQRVYDLTKNLEILDKMDCLEGLNEKDLDLLYKDIMLYIKKKDEKSLLEHLKTIDVFLPFYQENGKVSPDFYDNYICVYTSKPLNMHSVLMNIKECFKLCEEFEDIDGIIINPYDRYQFIIKKKDYFRFL